MEERELTNDDNLDVAEFSESGDGTSQILEQTRFAEHSQDHEGDWSRGNRDSRPMLVPGVMISLSTVGADAIMFFAEEVKRRHQNKISPCNLAPSILP